MTMILQGGPLKAPVAGFRRFTVEEYHKLIETGFLTETDKLELLEGYLVEKMSRNPPHDGTIDLVLAALRAVLIPNWLIRVQAGVTLTDSEPEPDLAVVRGNQRTYLQHHPFAGDVGLLIEVSDSSLAIDRLDKCRIYARSSIPCYWIINLVDQQIEVFEQPSGTSPSPAYGTQQIYQPGDTVPLILDGAVVGTIPVVELLP